MIEYVAANVLLAVVYAALATTYVLLLVNGIIAFYRLGERFGRWLHDRFW